MCRLKTMISIFWMQEHYKEYNTSIYEYYGNFIEKS